MGTQSVHPGLRVNWLAGMLIDLRGEIRCEIRAIERARPWSIPRGGERAMIVRPMMRCTTCKRWWSGDPVNGHTQMCPCGGELAAVDMDAHMASLPKKVDTPAEIAELKAQKERAEAAKAAKEAAAKDEKK